MSKLGIRTLVRFFLERERKKRLKRYAEYGDIIDLGIKIRVDNEPKGNSKLLSIGNKSMIDAQFVYESGKGHVKIGNNTFIGGCTIISHNSVTIGDYVQIAWGTYLYDHNAHSTDLRLRRNDIIDEYEAVSCGRSDTENKNWEIVRSKPIIIEDDVWIGMNCVILNGVTIGRGAVIGAGSVIRRNVPPYCVVIGNPARVIRFLYTPEEIEDVQKSTYTDNSKLLSKINYRNMIEQYLNKEV